MIHPQARVHIELAKEIVRQDKADGLRVILRPFQERDVERSRPVHDLEGRARAAICWRTYDHLVPVTKPKPLDSYTALDKSLTASYERKLEPFIGLRPQETLRRYLWEEIQPRTVRMHPFAFGPFRESLFVPCALVLIGDADEAKRFEPLLTLWRDGNFPLGFDQRGNLLVLVVA